MRPARPPAVSVAVGFTTFPGEICAAPRSWVEPAYPSLAYFNAVDRGGHFPAWEEPELFSTEVRLHSAHCANEHDVFGFIVGTPERIWRAGM